MKYFMDLQRKSLDLDQRKGFVDEHKDELEKAARRREEAYQKADDLLLQWLWFPEILHRHMEIVNAHKKTFGTI
jgi:hypothetical protein